MKNLGISAVFGLFLGVSSNASAGPILNISEQGLSAASVAEQAFLDSAGPGYLTETFDDNSNYNIGNQSATIISSLGVGSFHRAEPGSGGLCDSGSYSCEAGFAVLDDEASPFNGRYSVSGDNWLDSMDARQMVISPAVGFNSIGFYITDPNDAGGRLSVGGVDFDFDNIFGSSLGNGGIFYVTLFDVAGLGNVSLFSNNPDDGYGIDNVTVANVTEPGTLALFALGLLGLGLARRSK
tara:strand:+ start:3165 stop:3878 length:714 start_codon:yes stop_codon:yes gene_type:complete